LIQVSFTDPIFVLWYNPDLLRIKKVTPEGATDQKENKTTSNTKKDTTSKLDTSSKITENFNERNL
jgi:hypothetical protein